MDDTTNEPVSGESEAIVAKSSSWLKPKKQRTQAIRPELTEDEKIRLITNCDRKEQNWGFGFAVMTVLLSIVVLLIGFRTLHNPAQINVVNGKCPSGYSLVTEGTQKPPLSFCNKINVTAGGLWLQFAMMELVAFGIAFTARNGRRSRMTFAIFIGGLLFVTTSTAFAPMYMAFGAWLLIRSNRLQKETGGKAAHAQRLREDREAKKAGRTTSTNGQRPSSSVPVPKPNKRYTPKVQNTPRSGKKS